MTRSLLGKHGQRHCDRMAASMRWGPQFPSWPPAEGVRLHPVCCQRGGKAQDRGRDKPAGPRPGGGLCSALCRLLKDEARGHWSRVLMSSVSLQRAEANTDTPLQQARYRSPEQRRLRSGQCR